MKFKHLIFDFDGVLVESNDIRIEGFRLLFEGYQEDQVKELVKYVSVNGGKSRYEKIEYFFDEIRNTPISNKGIQALAQEYSNLVKQKVINAAPVNGAVDFLYENYSNYDMVIISGSDQEELREICQARKIAHFFLEILGSPVSKNSNMSALLDRRGWNRRLCLLIGDSINDLETAKACGIDFIGRNSGLENWKLINGVVSIDDFSQLIVYL